MKRVLFGQDVDDTPELLFWCCNASNMGSYQLSLDGIEENDERNYANLPYKIFVLDKKEAKKREQPYEGPVERFLDYEKANEWTCFGCSTIFIPVEHWPVIENITNLGGLHAVQAHLIENLGYKKYGTP